LGGHPDFGFGSITGGRKLKAAAAASNGEESGQDNGTLASVEMARRRKFGVKGAMKM
jgi:hypothetical protein